MLLVKTLILVVILFKTASVAVGKDSIAKGNTTTAIGTNATVNSAGANYSQGIAIGGGADPGQGATVVGDQGIAIWW